jgi:alkylation response protein AidB-like acyl-CoA dehydrogenase
VVWARTSPEGNKGLSAFIVEGGTKGLIVGKHEDKMGLRASNTVALTFEDCEIPADQLLGKEGEGFKLAMVALDGGRIGIASQACGVARAALEAAVRYTKDRQAFGQPVADFQAPRFMMADMKVQLSAAELLTLRAAYLKETGRPFTREASMAKLYASEMANRVCDKAVQLHGGYGYIDEFPVERYFRDARVQTIYEGTSEVQRMVIARETFKLFS